MAEEAAAPAQSQAQPSVTSLIKTALFSSQPADSDASASPLRGRDETGDVENRKAPSAGKPPAQKASSVEQVPKESQQAEEAESETEDQAEAEVDETGADDAQSEEAQFSTLTELAEAIGWDLDKISDLSLPVKIDGKEGTARLRDLVKSYQLDGHINQKLASFDNDRKAWETKRAEGERALVERLVRLDAGVKTLERALEGEFSGIDWQKLAAENPTDYNSRWVSYQQRYAVLNDIAAQLGQEQQKFQEAQKARAEEMFREQAQLAEAKLPEYADATKRVQFKNDATAYFKEYGLTQQDFESIADHRQLLVVRDALKWHQLQKSKPKTLNKVRVAPKLLKPGSPQSRATVEGLAAQREHKTLKQSGRTRDAVPLIKRALFGGSR